MVFFRNSTTNLFEGGLFDEWLQHTNEALFSLIRQNVRLFEDLDEYTDAFSSSVSSVINLENLQNVLRFLFGAQLAILFGFITKLSRHRILRFFCKAKKSLERHLLLHRKLRRTVR